MGETRIMNRRRFLGMMAIGGAGIAASLYGAGGKFAYAAGTGRVIDVHNHLHGAFGPPNRHKDNFKAAVKNTIGLMDRFGIEKVFLMPPPFPPNHRGVYHMKSQLEYIRPYPDRFRWLGGGGSLSPIIIESAKKKNPDTRTKDKMRKHAEEISRLGGVGLGEFAAEHYGLGPGHQYITAAIDHPAYLMLADLAAEYSLPIDLHMEAVAKEIPLPSHLSSPPNPKRLKPNIPAFETFLAHNRKATVIWSHVGWCNTGHRTPDLIGRLLKKHPNLFMSFKISPVDSLPQVRPLEMGGSGIKAEWLTLLRAHKDRFLIGSDQFFTLSTGSGGGRGQGQRSKSGAGGMQVGGKSQIGPESIGPTMRFYQLLPNDLAGPIGRDNAVRVFRL